MEDLQIKEALNTAILLSAVSRHAHSVDIDGVGEVKIDGQNGAMISLEGIWKSLTLRNMEKRLSELLSESQENRVKRRMSELIFPVE